MTLGPVGRFESSEGAPVLGGATLLGQTESAVVFTSQAPSHGPNAESFRRHVVHFIRDSPHTSEYTEVRLDDPTAHGCRRRRWS